MQEESRPTVPGAATPRPGPGGGWRGAAPVDEGTPAAGGMSDVGARPARDGQASADGSPVGAVDVGTGDAVVDQALGMIGELDAKPVHEHPPVLDGIHRALQERLADEPSDLDGHG